MTPRLDRRAFLSKFGALGAVALGCPSGTASAAVGLPLPAGDGGPDEFEGGFPVPRMISPDAEAPVPDPRLFGWNSGEDDLRTALSRSVGEIPAIMRPALAAAEASVPLRLYNQNTKENFDVQLFEGSQWNANALKVCDWLMRDWRQNMLVDCDRRIYAALYVIQRVFSQEGRIQIHSGFRSEATNNLLRERGYGAAPNSMHKHAKAVDFSIKGVEHRTIARAAWNLNLGGIGLYDGWVHLDTRGQAVKWGLPL
jgi:uncharacterized protein YcbK (DUF882 family)